MNEKIPNLLDESDALAPLNVIRTETALSRFPIHRLVKRGDVQIEIRNQAAALLWEVTYNTKYGQPGPLAYKLDTLVVNKRIEEAKREVKPGTPLTRHLRLGSLRDICRELGNTEGGESTKAIRNALLQNASAFINAKITYKTADRAERTLETGFTRYSVVFTGETLPDGSTADAVYLLLNETYWQVIESALARPLDFNYMRSLPPSAQRFYEVVSYQIYAALHFQNERARLRYSEYCMLSTATRYLTFDQVKKQMYKVHKPHLESGYLGSVGYEQTTDDAGQPDWWMYYVPGHNASREYHEFTGNVRRVGGRGNKRAPKAVANAESLFLPFVDGDFVPAAETVRPEAVASNEAAPSAQETPEDFSTVALVAQLVAADLNRETAERFARERPDECRRQLAYLPFVTEFKSSRGAYLRRAIEQGFAPPAAYARQQEAEEAHRKKREETERRKAAEAVKRATEAAGAVQTAQDMAQLEIEAPAAFLAFTAYAAQQRRQAEGRYGAMSASIRAKAFTAWDAPEKRQELFQAWRKLPEAERMAFAPTTAVDEDPAAIRSLIEKALLPETDEAKNE